jgi:hypothetical protein
MRCITTATPLLGRLARRFQRNLRSRAKTHLFAASMYGDAQEPLRTAVISAMQP